MGKPRMLILIRHGQSEGNKNRAIHQTIPDHRVKLTQEGWQQAHDAGRRLREMLRPEDTLHFFTSPYRRTRETTEGILATLTSDEPAPSPFKRNDIKVYEEPRLREQDFGNFQPCSAEMERMWQERADYGHFFYRIPNGESAADAYDRISGFNESLWRQFGEDDFASVCVLVTHGLMSRVFLMKWYHFSVEYFEDLRNVRHCEFLIMRQQQDSGKFLLETKLRTWTELKRERLLSKDKDQDGQERDGRDKDLRDNRNHKDCSKLEKVLGLGLPATCVPIEIRRRWGGCPDGCNNDKSLNQTVADLIKSKDSVASEELGGGSSSSSSSVFSRHPVAKRVGVAEVEASALGSPDGSPKSLRSLHSLLERMYVGRDGGGTYSGGTYSGRSSQPPSEMQDYDDEDDDASETEHVSGSGGTITHHKRERDQSGMGRGTRANRLGDQPTSSEGDNEADRDCEADDLAAAELVQGDDARDQGGHGRNTACASTSSDGHERYSRASALLS